MPTYARADVVFERGEGPYLFDTNGKRYLDFASGVAVTAFGHAHPYLIKALTDQAHKVWHTSNLFRVAGQESLGRRLVDNTFADTVFFTNSGVEAWECAIKVVRKYQYETGHPERWRIITAGGAFHGRTTTAIAATKQEKMVKGFGPMQDGFDQVAFGNMNELRAAITNETAGISIEPVQGEGGIRAGSLDYLRALRQVCDEYGLLLLFDEIQTGMGRTGKLFAYEWAGVTPDVMAVAKGIGGGFPLGACLATEKAAVGNAVLDLMLEPGFLEGVDRIARVFWGRLNELAARHPKVIAEVRGAGLLLGLRIQPEIVNGTVVDKLRDAGMLTVGAGDNVVRLLPPLIITEAEIDEAIGILDKVLPELAP